MREAAGEGQERKRRGGREVEERNRRGRGEENERLGGGRWHRLKRVMFPCPVTGATTRHDTLAFWSLANLLKYGFFFRPSVLFLHPPVGRVEQHGRPGSRSGGPGQHPGGPCHHRSNMTGEA